MSINFQQRQLSDLTTALGSAPYNVAAPLIAHINSEITRLYNEQYDRQRESKQEPLQHHSV